MARRLTALVVAAGVAMTACSSDGPAVTGVVVAVDGDLTSVQSFDVQSTDGERLTFVPGPELSAFDHGSPLRVISPFDLAYKSAKHVTGIELSDKAEAGWWTLANPIYPIDAPVPERRLRSK